MNLTVFVPGRPVPQGSKTAFVNKKTGRPVVVDKDVRLPRWRMTLTAHFIDAQQRTPMIHDFPLGGPIGMKIDFVLDRPKSHFGTGRNAGVLKDSAPKYPASMPDIDKLLRAILDGITDAQVWRDDGQVVWVQTSKNYPSAAHPHEGVHVTLGEMT